MLEQLEKKLVTISKDQQASLKGGSGDSVIIVTDITEG